MAPNCQNNYYYRFIHPNYIPKDVHAAADNLKNMDFLELIGLFSEPQP